MNLALCYCLLYFITAKFQQLGTCKILSASCQLAPGVKLSDETIFFFQEILFIYFFQYFAHDFVFLIKKVFTAVSPTFELA